MKIFIVIGQNPFFTSSASANRWLTLIEGLVELGAMVELLIYGGYQSEEEVSTWELTGNKNGVNYKYIAPQLIKGYWESRYYIYIGSKLREGRLLSMLKKELQKNDGIVWTDSSFFGFKLAVYMKEKQHNQKLFLEMSEFLDNHEYNKGNFLQCFFASKRQKYFEEKALHEYSGLALMTKTLIKHYKSFPEPIPKLLHLPMTVDLKRFNSGYTLQQGFEKPYIAYVGVMNDTKDGINILIEAFAQIHKQFPNHKIYLIGGWHYDTPNHLKLIKEYGLADKVFWKGAFSRNQIPALIKNACLLVLPRPNSKQAQGGFPTKLGEYLATGNPVCATRVGEIPDYLKDGESVYFAEPDSVDSFANAMQRALSNPEEAKGVGAIGRKIAEKNFNKDIQSKILYDFLQKLL